MTILPATDEHVRLLAPCLREGDRREIEGLGLRPHRALWRSYKNALYARTGLVGGEVAAMWGVSGKPLGLTGIPWMLTSALVEAIPGEFVKIARQQVTEMMELFPRLENVVAADYRGAVRLLESLGFTLDEPFPVPSGALYRRFHLEAM